MRPGVSTGTLDALCHEFITAHDAVPAPLNYRGYPKSICTSINHVVCHGIPGERKLENGDILNIDVTVILNGWHGNSSRMYVAGTASTRARNLMDVTYEAMMRGVRAVKPGVTLGDVGHVIQNFVEGQRFSVVRDFCGHGIGRRFHEPPNVLHFGRPGEGPVLRPGMFFTIEPMVNAGRPEVKVLDDGWTAVTRDRSLSAQFEHMIGVTEDRVRDLHPLARRVRQAALRGVSSGATPWTPAKGVAPSLRRGRLLEPFTFRRPQKRMDWLRHCVGPGEKAPGGFQGGAWDLAMHTRTATNSSPVGSSILADVWYRRSAPSASHGPHGVGTFREIDTRGDRST